MNKKINIINACSDFGVSIDGAKLGPEKLTEGLKNISVYTIKSNNVKKQKEKENKAKNLNEVNRFNEQLYYKMLETLNEGNFPITIGGDHSIAIGSALATIKKYHKMGIIWIDAHGDYNTFETTETGNIHGIPLAAITGYEKKYLTRFHSGDKYNPKNTVIVGGRDIDELEKVNLREAGVTVFTTKDIYKYGIKNIMEKAIKIASNNTNGIHISFDIDVIDPKIAMGVSVPAEDGITVEQAIEASIEIISNKKIIKSIDLVEYNPLFDKKEKTKKIAQRLLNNFLQIINE